MKLEVFQEKPIKENITFLKLTNDGWNIVLHVVDANGNPVPQGNLLYIDEDGKLNLCCRINSSLGLDIDLAGRLKIK